MKLLIASIKEYMHQISIKEVLSLLSIYLTRPETATNDARDEKPLADILNTYQQAWPLLMTLKEQGASQLIHVLENAEPTSLKAFNSLTIGTELNEVVKPFLIENHYELSSFDRSRVIQLLSQHDLQKWLDSFLNAFIEESSQFFSAQILLDCFIPHDKNSYRMKDLTNLLSTSSLEITPECLSVLINYYEGLSEPLSPEISAQIDQLLEYFFRNSSIEKQVRWIRSLSKESLLKLIDRFLVPFDEQHELALQLIPLLCSEWIVANPNYLKEIRLKLESSTLASDPSFELAYKALTSAEKHSHESALNTSIATLLNSPKFVSTTSPEKLRQLSNRYRLFCLTLSAKEFANSEFFNSLSPFFTELNEQLRQIETALSVQDRNTTGILSDKANLMVFRSNESLFALLKNLELQCLNPGQLDARIAKQALTSLYHLYCQDSQCIRHDLYLRIIDHFYSNSLINKYTQPPQKPLMIRWLEKLLLAARKPVEVLAHTHEYCLYNSEGRAVAYLTEDNQAFTFRNGALLEFNPSPTTDGTNRFYDRDGEVLGYFLKTGQFVYYNDFSKRILVYILNGISEWELSKYPESFDLLLRQSLYDSSISKVYKEQVSRRNPNVLPWLERQLTRVLTQQGPFPIQSVKSLFSVLREEYAFELLGLIRDRQVALELLDSLLLNKVWRKHLLLSLYASDVHQFLKIHDPVVCLAYCLLNHYKSPWIFDLINRFTFYGNKTDQPYLFLEALSLVAQQAAHDPAKTKALHLLLLKIIKSDSGIALLMKEINTYEINKESKQDPTPEIIHFFNKNHLIAALKLIHKTADLEYSKQYQFIVYLLANNHDALFQSGSGDHEMRNLFTAKEIALLIEFTNRQLNSESTNTTNSLIGNRILGDLLFRSARKGIISLFYSNNRFNPAMTRKAILMPYFKSLLYKFWLPEEIKQNLPHTRTWTEDTRKVEVQLKECPLLFDLFQLSKQIWNKADLKQLPIICVFLLSYQGEKGTLLQLLNDYIHYFQDKKLYIYTLGKLLTMYPGRQVSAVIYEALERAIDRNTSLLDANLFNTMAIYRGKQSNSQDDDKLNLLKIWGQNKQYSLVEAACNLLIINATKNKSLYVRIRNEARAELLLETFQEGFPFNVIKYFLRLWHYGWSPEKNCTQIVRFCDDGLPTSHYNATLSWIDSPVDNHEQLSLATSFTNKHKQFINLLNTIATGPRTYEKSQTLSDKQHVFFGRSCTEINTPEVKPTSSQELPMSI